MRSDSQQLPLTMWSWILRQISLLIRRRERASWLAPREGNLHGLLVLDARGEFAGGSLSPLLWLHCEALSSAFRMRCGGFNPCRLMRSPVIPILAATAGVLLIGAVTRFAGTLRLWSALGDPGKPANQNTLVGNLFPVAFALAASLIVAVGRMSLRGYGRRYFIFFMVKTASLVAILVLVWIEGGPAIRGHISNQTLCVLTGGLLLALGFIGAMCWAMLWSLADQQYRCGVCLRRLVMPVRIGTCASVFEPETVEWLCEDGHGTFYESAREANAPRHFIGQELAPAGGNSTRPF